MEPPTSYSARLVVSESCHLLVTTTLKIWVVFSRSHSTVSFDSHGSSRELSEKGQDQTESSHSTQLGAARWERAAAGSGGSRLAVKNTREITNYSDICLVSKGSRRARSSTESCLIPHSLKVEAKQQEYIGSF